MIFGPKSKRDPEIVPNMLSYFFNWLKRPARQKEGLQPEDIM